MQRVAFRPITRRFRHGFIDGVALLTRATMTLATRANTLLAAAVPFAILQVVVVPSTGPSTSVRHRIQLESGRSAVAVVVAMAARPHSLDGGVMHGALRLHHLL